MNIPKLTMTPRKALSLASLALIAALASPSIVIAQCPAPPPTSPLAEGEVGVFFDPLGTETCAVVTPGATIPLYVVVRVPEGGIAEFDIPGLDWDALPGGLIVLGSGRPDGDGYEVLVVLDDCSRAQRIDPNTCPRQQGELLVIAVAQVFAAAPVLGTTCFQTQCPSFAGTVSRPPSYLGCEPGTGGTFTGWDAMCVGFGQPPVSTTQWSWGAMKSRY